MGFGSFGSVCHAPASRRPASTWAQGLGHLGHDRAMTQLTQQSWAAQALGHLGHFVTELKLSDPLCGGWRRWCSRGCTPYCIQYISLLLLPIL